MPPKRTHPAFQSRLAPGTRAAPARRPATRRRARLAAISSASAPHRPPRLRSARPDACRVDLTEAVSFLQGGPAYGAVNVRRAYRSLAREGAATASDLKVSQRAGGAGMAVDVAAGQAHVQGDAVAYQGLYYCVLSTGLTGATELTVPPAHASLPRLDSVWLDVKDTLYDGSGLNKATVRYTAGTAPPARTR